MLTAIQPEDDPSVVIVRPYGIAKFLGGVTFPIDYTMMKFAGSFRGQKIGQWKESLLVSVEPQEVNAPTLFTWRSSDYIHKFGNSFIANDEEV